MLITAKNQSRIKALIDNEDKQRPYSDERLRKLLEKEGIRFQTYLS